MLNKIRSLQDMASPNERIRKSLSGNPEEALRLFSERALWSDLNLAESEFVLEEALKCYGSVQDGDLIAELFAFYRRYMGLADVARRQALLTRLVEFVSDGRQNRAMALLCFIASDTDGQIISGAALDLAMVLPADKDPLAGPKLVAMHSCGGLRELTGSKPSDDEGHAAAGLLLLGDSRLLPILKDIWDRLSTDARNNMIKRRGNLAYKATIEFLLQRLEEDKDEVHFGELGAFLHDLAGIAASATQGLVLDARRNFGLPKGREPMELLSRQTVGEVYHEIKPRLEKLIAGESVPKILPNVLNQWAEVAGENSEHSPSSDSAVINDVVSPESFNADESFFCISEELDEEFSQNRETDTDAENPDFPISLWLNWYYSYKHISGKKIIDELPAGEFFPLLLTGQFNPLGPTITCYVVRRDMNNEWNMSTYVLNPFACSTSWVAALDDTKLSLEVGAFDQQATSRRRDLVFKGRAARDAGILLQLLVYKFLARSRLQPSFTLCHVTRWLEEKAVFGLVCSLHLAKKNGAQDTDWLRDEQTRNDPWSRLDPVSAMNLKSGKTEKGRELSMGDTHEFAIRVLSRKQQQIELQNILTAWDGAISMAGGRSVVLDRESLMRILVNFTTDMPGLLNFEKVEKDSDAESKPQSRRAASESKPVPVAPKQAVPMQNPGQLAAKKPTELTSEPIKDKAENFTGLTALVYNFSLFEVVLALVAIIWSLATRNWLLAVSMLVFAFLNMARAVMMHDGHVSTRWWGVVLYVSMGSFVIYRLNNFSTYNGMSDSSSLLHQGIFWWVAIMALLHILCFDFAKQVGAAKKS